MSHNFRAPTSIDPQERRDERAVKLMAFQIADQAMLDTLLAHSAADMRAAMIERLRPYLSFIPDEKPSADCAECGMRRGSVIAHECRPN